MKYYIRAQNLNGFEINTKKQVKETSYAIINIV